MQRIAVMEYLINNRIHPTIDEIYMALNPKMPTLSKTTVYNTLNLFLEKGAVQELVIDDKNARYDIDISMHAHFICKSCGQVQDVFDVNPALFQFPVSDKFKVTGVEISYSGFCNSCQSN
jgi:Fur family ferric uptake transcriptional regulator/Fur family peroxide stress response transcriptional regulator